MSNEIQTKVLSNHIEIAYTDTGKKSLPIILFIHGLGNYHGVWNWNAAALKTHFRCISVDLPGNGSSGRNHKKYSIDFYASAMNDFIREMKFSDVTVAGHSMGGLIAMRMALSEKVDINKLLLFAPAGFEYYTPHESILFKSAISMGNFLNLDETQISQSVRSSFYKQTAITDKIIHELSYIIQQNDRPKYRLMLEQSIHSMLDDDIFKKLKNIYVETLVFFGENDMLIPNRFLHAVSTQEIARKAVKEMPQAKLITYKNTGHFVQIERAKEVNGEIISFMKVPQSAGVA